MARNSPQELKPARLPFRRDRIPAFQEALREWFARSQRDLPWRSTRSLYRTVVSEFMLQQTRVATILPAFARWMSSFPDFQSLAQASEEEVLKHWEGLGYYSRARNLHRLAKEISAHPGPLPRDPAFWKSLPGIGPYTAASITSISFQEPVACIDGNVIRILSRLTQTDTLFDNAAKAHQVLGPLAEVLLSKDAPGVHNEAMMELGATVCLRRKPLCERCPVTSFCLAGPSGNAEQYPRIQRKKTIRVEQDLLWWVHRGRLLLRKAQESSGRLAGLYEFPVFREVLPRTSKPPRIVDQQVRHITHYHITERLCLPPSSASPEISLPEHCQWIPLADLPHLAMSGPHRRWLEKRLSGDCLPAE